ncbi:tetratricopeptide repeat protein [Urbifossiella limnaea]|uniref:tetratricopeptide repeat protein n=1 Tax=Urbifossiella limnaea TaxID=2528023 RepID=UPI00119ECE3B|nr:tetratricopeptide repeat protein [Urbifossiella limnaea]
MNRPTALPGGLGGASKLPPNPGLTAVNRPGSNSNNRPSVLPAAPDLPNNRPGINLPNRPEAKPNLPSIGERPNLPGGPDRPNASWPSRPDTLPARPGGTPDPKLPNLPQRPDRPGVSWPNRPGPGGRPDLPGGDRPVITNRPGISVDGKHNTVVNNELTSNRTVVNQINQSNNYYGGNTNVVAGGSRVGTAIHDYHGAWHNNYSYWQRSYHPWYHGAWNGNSFRNSWGIGAPAVGFGVTAWGLNSLAYSFGYSPYVNPFYVAPAPTVIVVPALNYSQPVINVVQALPDSGAEPPPMPETAAQAFDVALAEFKKGNHRTALDKTEQALKDFPNDPAMHQFRALCLFALGDYQQASAAIHALLASGPGWDWTTMSSLYPDTDTYSNQLGALEKAATTKPNDPALWFLLAYHYTTVGQDEPARDALARARTLLPTDPVVSQLAQAAGVPAVNVEPKEPRPQPPADIQLDLAGDWSAARPDGGKIGLALKADGAFTWTVQDKAGKRDSFDGTFTLEDSVLILERKSGGALMGRVTALADNRFLFRLIGGGDADPGLTFAK